MNNQITQNLRYKLERRVIRLRAVDFGAFQQTLQEFWNFFDNEQILFEIKEHLLNQFPNVNETVIKMFQSNMFPEVSSVEESAAISCEVLHQILTAKSQGRGFLNTISQRYMPREISMSEPQRKRDQRNLKVFMDLYLEPFYIYVDEQIDNQKAILNFILRYKHRSEWFHSERLLKIANDEKAKRESGEKKRAEIEDRLATDLYSYLYDEGINFHIAPSSITGKIDLIEEKRPLLEGQEDSSHRLLADAKVFDGKNRNCSYIGKGFGQILRYCKKYNEFFGYLIIYNISDGELEFELESTINRLPIYAYYGKTIVFIVIDINKTQADSLGGNAKTYKIEEKHLLEEKRAKLKESAEIMKSEYENDKNLTAMTSLDSDEFV